MPLRLSFARVVHCCAVILVSSLVILLPPAAADTFEWTTAAGGDFDEAGNWTVVPPDTGTPPPAAADTANFNEIGTYIVFFTQNEASDELFVTAGTVSFLSDSATLRTYSFTPDGGVSDPDIDVSGGTLNVGAAGNPLFINGTDAILFVGVGTNGTLNVAGAGSRLDAEGTSRTHAIGGTGGDGTLNLTDGAVANIGTGFTLDVGSSNSSGTNGVVSVASGSTLNTGNMDIADRTSGATGMVTVNGTNSVINQILAGASLTVGSASGGTGTIDITGGGTFSTGTGATTINATGTVNVGAIGGGTFNANGPVTVNAGGQINIFGSPDMLDPPGVYNANADVLIDGGSLITTFGGVFAGAFNLASGQTLTASNDALINFTGGYLINEGTTFDIQSGSVFSTSGFLDIGVLSNGTLLVDGAGSSVTTGNGLTFWGRSGGTADVTFRNNATGNLGDIVLASSATAGTTGTVSIESGATVMTDSLTVASDGATATGTITVDGAGSTLTQTSIFFPTVVGNSLTGTAAINITNGGTFTTATGGTTTIDATGTLNVGLIGGGTFNADGNVIVDGGIIMRGSTGVFNLAAGLTLTASNNAQVNFTNFYTIDEGTTFEINSGADFSTGFVPIAFGSDGTLVVDDASMSMMLTGFGSPNWGSSGGTADVTFRNNATGNLIGVGLAIGTTAGTTGIFNVESGAMVTTDGLRMASIGGATTNGTLTVDGAGSMLTQNGASTLTVGHAIEGTATINVTNSGIFTTGTGLTNIDTTGTLNVNTGGTFNVLGDFDLLSGSTVNLVGGTLSAVDPDFTSSTFNFPFGTLELNSNQSLDVPRLAELNVATLPAGKGFRVGGTATLLTPLVLAGGTFGADSLVNPFLLDFQTGTFELTGDNLTIGTGGLFGSTLELASGQQVDVTNNVTIDAVGRLELSGGTLSSGAGLTNNGLITGDGEVGGTVTIAAGGEVRVSAGESLLLTGSGNTNAGTVESLGGEVEFTGDLTNQSTGQIIGRGAFRFGGAGLTNNGHVAFSSAISDIFGDVTNDAGSPTVGITVSGNADATFWDDVQNTSGRFQVSSGSSATFFGTFAGNGITGIGDVFMEADVTPGLSPGVQNFGGNVHFGPVARLEIELAGLMAGSEFDQVNIDGAATLAGTLDISLINGFTPSAGDTFEIITAASILGTFTAETLPTLPGGLEWFVIYSATSVELISTFAGDFDIDGDVDGRDFLLIQRNDPSLIPQWETVFGTGVGAASSPTTAVPEPAGGTLAALAFAAWFTRKRAKSRFVSHRRVNRIYSD